MPKASPIQNAFNAGELSPLLDARSDLDKYGKGFKAGMNVVPVVQGALHMRPGTKFVGETKPGESTVRLVRFEFSTTQAYVLEFGPNYMRVYRDHGLVLESDKPITNATNANPVEITTGSSHGFNTGDEVFISGVGGMVEVNNKRFIITKTSNTKFELQGVDGTGFGSYTSGGDAARVFELSTPYAEDHIKDLYFVQSADILYVCHSLYQTREIHRLGHANWTIQLFDFFDGPYFGVNTTSKTFTAGAATGNGVSLTASSATFTSNDVGRWVRLFGDDGTGTETNKWGWAKIVGFTSTTQVTIDIFEKVTTDATEVWRLGVWRTSRWPDTAIFYENRLFLGGSSWATSRFDGSESGNFVGFAPSDADGTVTDAHAVSFTLNADDVNALRWMMNDEKGLLIGTTGGEWVVRPSSFGEALSPTNINARQSTSFGSPIGRRIFPVKAEKAVLFPTRSRKKLREFAYFFEDDGFRASDLTVLSNFILVEGVTELAYQREPHNIVWVAKDNGELAAMTFEKEQNVIGWHRHRVGGFDDAGQTQPAVVESVVVIPSPDGSTDEVYLLVRRYINGETKRYVEYLTTFWDADKKVEDAFFVDSGLTYDGAPATTLSGLDHLEGETVTILADGAPHQPKTVTNGQITLDRQASKVHVGYGYVGDCTLFPFIAGAADGTAQGKLKRIHRVTFRFWRTLGVKVGPDTANLDPIVFREGGQAMGSPPPLFTGDRRVNWGGGYDLRGEIHIRQDQPLPMVLLAVMPQGVTQDA